MSKCEPLWKYIKETGNDNLLLSYEKIEEILGFSIDRSFLTYKKELLEYGYQVKKISMKNKTVEFIKA